MWDASLTENKQNTSNFRMKITRIMFPFLALHFVCIMNSCKYDEGPHISCRSAYYRLAGQYHVKQLLIEGSDHTWNYYDSCNCDFIFTYVYKPSYIESIELINCKAITQRNRIHGVYSLYKNSTKIVIDFRNVVKPSLDSMWRDSVFGYGPFNSGYISEWEIVRLKDLEMVFEGTYMGKFYRIEFQEFEY